MTEEFFNLKPNPEKLLEFGFVKKECEYVYTEDIMDGQFSLTVSVAKSVSVKVYDNDDNSEYTLYKASGANGAFVARVREEIAKMLSRIKPCFFEHKFAEDTSAEILRYALEKHGDKPEFLWEDTPDFAVLRRKSSSKWYAVLMKIKRSKLGLVGEGFAEVVNLHLSEANVQKRLQRIGVFSAYHMNKKYWVTVIADGSVPIEDIYDMMDESYALADKRKNKKTELCIDK